MAGWGYATLTLYAALATAPAIVLLALPYIDSVLISLRGTTSAAKSEGE